MVEPGGKNRTKLLQKLLAHGDRLRLRNNVFRHVQAREWIFDKEEEGDRILLLHETGGFGWSIKADDIDWEAYQKSKEERAA